MESNPESLQGAGTQDRRPDPTSGRQGSRDVSEEALRQERRAIVRRHMEARRKQYRAAVIPAEVAAVWFWSGQSDDEKGETVQFLVDTGQAHWLYREECRFKGPAVIEYGNTPAGLREAQEKHLAMLDRTAEDA